MPIFVVGDCVLQLLGPLCDSMPQNSPLKVVLQIISVHIGLLGDFVSPLLGLLCENMPQNAHLKSILWIISFQTKNSLHKPVVY